MKKLITLALMAILAVSVFADTSDGPLSLKDIEFELDGDKEGSSPEGRPGDKIELTIEIENTNPSDGADLENVNVEVTFEEFNSDVDEYTEDKEEDKIRGQRDKSFKFEHEVPLLVDEADYTVEIEVTADNETGSVEYSFSESYTLSIDKRKHELQFDGSPEFISDSVSCANDVELRYRLVNTGEEDEDVRLSITNSQLGIAYVDEFDLNGDSDDSDAVRSKNVLLDLPESRTPGNYVFNVKAQYGSDDETEQLTLRVEECATAQDSSDEEEEEPEATTTTTTTTTTGTTTDTVADTTAQQQQFQPVAVTTSTKSNSNTALYVLIGLGYLIVIALVVVMVVLIKKKK